VFDDVPPSLREEVQLQSGVLSAAQLVGAGLSREMLSSRVKHGRWQRLNRGVYATFSGEPGRVAVLWAAVLSGGPGAMLSYNTAAELHRLSDAPSTLIHLTVPVQRRVARTPGIVIHLSSRAGETVHPAQLPPRTRIEETILDLAGTALAIDDACDWVTRGLGRRLTTQAKLKDALDHRGRMRWRWELTELLGADRAGLHSILELRYNRDVERPHRLPTGTRQARVKRGTRSEYRDCFYEAYLTVVELDGGVAHPGDARWRDIRRDNAAAADGIITLRYGWLDVTSRPCRVAAEIADVLAQRGYAGARPCSPNCPVGQN
jgi:Transcriptional regulator, AbiEi antitoxin